MTVDLTRFHQVADWAGGTRVGCALIAGLLAVALAADATAQSSGPAIFVANNGNCEGSVTSFTVNGDGTLNFVQKIVTGSVPCGSGQTAPGLNAQAISISPSGRWLITGHGTISATVEQLTIYEVHRDATMSIKHVATTPDSPVGVAWIDDEYVAVTATPNGNDFVIIYKFDPAGPSLIQHFYQSVSYIFDIIVDPDHDLLFARDGLSGVTVFKINADRTITEVTTNPTPTTVYFLGPGLSPDGTKLYYGGGISSFNGLGSRWIGGLSVNTATGELTPMPDSPYLSPPSDGTSGPSPKEVDVSSDGKYAFVNHGGTAHIKGFEIDPQTGVLTPIENSYFDVGTQGQSGNMSILDNRLYVPRRYANPSPGDGVLALQINDDGSLTQLGGLYPTQGSLPWDIETWPGLQLCPADINGDSNVDVADLLAVISNWGGGAGNPADVDGSGVVDVGDLLIIIGAWGPC